MSSATKKVNESSNNFIKRIRDVAHKRKLSMTRSRDNLKATQKEKMLPINDEAVHEDDHADANYIGNAYVDDRATVESNLGDDKAMNSTNNSQESPKSRKSLSNQSLNNSNTDEYHFKARPVPETTGNKGVGGLTGVPKVAKRPLTTPFSPLLGSRRPEKVSVKALESPKKVKPNLKKKEKSKRVTITDCPKTPQPETSTPPTFKARPMPSFVGRKGRGGLTGVPKVQKRPLTVPRSPVLGVRRSSSMNQQKVQAFSEKKSVEENQTSVLSGSSMISRNSDLQGLVVLDTQQSTGSDVRVGNDENIRPKNNSNIAFQLQSTARAKERADYNIRRDEKMKRKKEQDLKSRQREVRKMEKELIALRPNL